MGNGPWLWLDLALLGSVAWLTTHLKLNKQQQQLKNKTSEVDMEARTADKKGKTKTGRKKKKQDGKTSISACYQKYPVLLEALPRAEGTSCFVCLFHLSF